MRRWLCLAAVLAVLLPVVSFAAELKDYVFIVKPVYHQKTRTLFLDLAKYFGNQGDTGAQAYFTGMAGEYAHGTGWVVVDYEGQNWVITNRHVVIGAEKVNVYQESEEGDQRIFSDCPIVYVDTQMDLAVIQFPSARKVFKSGFRLDTRSPKDLTDVVAAGFPGFGGTPLWQVSPGAITNSHAKIDPAYAYLIQHSAPIDPGNSGGPLLVKDPTAPLGYSVVGVNTMKALKRESTNFAIPTKHVAEVLERARQAKKLGADPAALRAELVKNAAILTGELNSDTPVDQDVNKYISYAIVGEKGWQAYQAVLRSVEDQKKFTTWFLDDPVEAMRTSIYWFFSAEVDHGAGTKVEFSGINPADEAAIGTRGGIRTTFLIGGAPREISWSLEYGHWRISDMTLRLPEPAKPAAAAPAAAAATAGAQAPQPAARVFYGAHSVMLSFGMPGPFIGVEYTGILWPEVGLGLSAGFGYGFDGSVFLIAGPALRVVRGLNVPLRVGLALTPLGTTFVINPGVIFKFDGFAFGLNLGYVFPDSVIIGLGVGIAFPMPPDSYAAGGEDDY
jgi:serine protease Do